MTVTTAATPLQPGAGTGAAAAPLPPVGTTRRQRRALAKPPKHLRSNGTAYAMIAPLVVLLGIFVVWPLVYAFYLSGYRTYYNKPAEFVGLEFYGYVLTDPDFWDSLRVGVTYSAIVVPTILVVALLLAAFLKSLGKRGAAILKTTVYVPTVVSVVIASLIFVFIYQDSGVANWMVGLFGSGPVNWLNDTATALPAISVPGVWLGFGVATLIMLAAMLDIPESYYESAALDGAGWWQRMRYITLPGLKNVFLYLVVTTFTLTMQEYLLPLVMTNGGPVSATTTPNLFIFAKFRDQTAFSFTYSLTAALILFLVLGLVSVLIFKAIKSDKAVDG